METASILEALERMSDRVPREALEAAVAQQTAITPHLLAALEDPYHVLGRIVADPAYALPYYALYLLAKFRERRAYPLIVALFMTPGERASEFTGDIVTEDLARILASVSGGELGPMQRLVEATDVGKFVPSAAIDGLVTLVNEGAVARDVVIDYFRTLFQGGLRRRYHFSWAALVAACVDLHPGELMGEIRQAFADRLVDEAFINYHEVRQAARQDKAVLLTQLREDRHLRYVDDVARAVSWWSCFHVI
ncbi:MAG: DUF1186 domain-containing protein [Anaerolineae bacterium]